VSKEYINGILEYCYNGIPVIRGYCSYKTLIKHSVAHPAYQRAIETTHVNEIKNFISSASSYKFMPEVVLSYDCAGFFEHPEDWSDPAYITPIEYLYNAADVVGGQIILRDHKTGLNIQRIKGNTKNYRLMKVDISSDSLLLKTPMFKRLDGNHRLVALEQLAPDDFQIPFCIILLSSSGQADLRDREKTEMEIFHNINAKAKPLTPIEQYRGLFTLFTVDELKRFGEEFSTTKAYLEKHRTLRFCNIEEYIRDLEDIILNCIKFFFDRGKDINEDDLADILNKLENTYFSDCEELKHFANRFSLIPYIYYCYEGGKKKSSKLDAYNTWFINNRLYNIKDFDPASMIETFDSIYEMRKKQIFVAMPFKPELDFVFNAIRDVIKKINHDYKIELLEPIRIDKQIVGFSYDIVEEILKNIQNAGLLIADLTEQNANVYYEAGFAQGLIRAQLGETVQILYLISNPGDPEKPFTDTKFDVEHFKILPYKDQGNGVDQLKEDLEKELKAYYSI